MKSGLNNNTPESKPISNNLSFDDAPLDLFLSGEEISTTPANAIELWRSGLDRSDGVSRAVAAIFARNSDSLHKEDDLDAIKFSIKRSLKTIAPKDRRYTLCLVALGALAEKQEDIKTAIEYVTKAHNLQVKFSRYLDASESTEMLAKLYEYDHQPKKAKSLRDALKLEELMRDPDNAVTVRAKALEMFHNQKYQDAERLYKYLLTLNFELASTYCHLARVYLMTGRMQLAMKQIELAWNNQEDVKSYVKPRLLFFQLIDRMLSKQNYTEILKEIAKTLNEPGAFEQWDMDKVINHIASKLSTDEKILLLTLVEALGDNKKMRDLTPLRLWNKR